MSAPDLWTLVEAAADRWPDDPMLVSRQGDTATFGEFRARAATMAAGLADEHEIGHGDVVSWILPTWVDTVVLAAALARLGAVQNPIIAIYRDREVTFCTRQAGARLLLHPGEFAGYDFAAMADRVATEVAGLDTVAVTPGSFPAGDPAGLGPAVPAAAGDVRWLCYTSGTTADPKGARHSDQTVGSFPLPMGERLDVTHGDRYSLVFPFPHIGGIGLLFMALHLGCTHLLDAQVDPTATIEFLADHRCTHAGTGTPFYNMYLAVQAGREGPLFPELKVCPGGGAPIPRPLRERVMAELGGAGVTSGWGLTEAPVLTNGAIDDPLEKRLTTEGRPLPGVTLRVVDRDGVELPPGTEGELRAKGPQVMLGYVDATLDAEAFDADGWYRTGDLGTLDAEGFVRITGRLKDVIVRNGENISAQEVEDLLHGLPAVAEAAVIGLPDERTGESVCAVVVPVAGAAPSLDEVRASLDAAGLRRQAIPTRVEVVDALPRNPAGKVTKRDLVARYGAAPDA